MIKELSQLQDRYFILVLMSIQNMIKNFSQLQDRYFSLLLILIHNMIKELPELDDNLIWTTANISELQWLFQ